MLNRKLLIITLFAIAMGYLESAVVVYLREIFYPEGFAFPLKSMSGDIALTEVLREAATLIMLAGIGYLAGKNRLQRFGIFIYAFGIWDIFYYVFLKLLLGWPESFLTWDILFLIPVTWVGPVLAPVINALSMCIFGALIFQYSEKNPELHISKREWSLLILGSLIIIFSYTQDYLSYIQAQMPLVNLFKPSEMDNVLIEATNYVPERFNWWIFGIGQMMVLIAIFMFNRKGTQRVSLRHTKVKV
jgi:hypothetical protein